MKAPDLTTDTFTAEWNALCDKHPGKFKRIQKFRPSWVPMLNARKKDDYFMEIWREAMSKIPDSPHLMGESPRDAKYAAWKPNGEWFLRPDTVYKLMDGDYGTAGACASAQAFDAWR